MASRAVSDWNDAAADVYTYFHERSRAFVAKSMLAVIDHLAVCETASQESLIAKYRSSDLLATVLGHVTTAIHGKGSVPKFGGWYSSSANPALYTLNPEFAAAWRTKRRLPRPERRQVGEKSGTPRPRGAIYVR